MRYALHLNIASPVFVPFYLILWMLILRSSLLLVCTSLPLCQGESKVIRWKWEVKGCSGESIAPFRQTLRNPLHLITKIRMEWNFNEPIPRYISKKTAITLAKWRNNSSAIRYDTKPDKYTRIACVQFATTLLAFRETCPSHATRTLVWCLTTKKAAPKSFSRLMNCPAF